MTLLLNRDAVAKAEELIKAGKVVLDERAGWKDVEPTTTEENEFIRLNGLEAYSRWHLGIDDEKAEGTKARYEFPYGDFKNVFRSGLLAAESRAGQYKHPDIEGATKQLLSMLGK